jgi:hypothetical protein
MAVIGTAAVKIWWRRHRLKTCPAYVVTGVSLLAAGLLRVTMLLPPYRISVNDKSVIF